MTVGSNVKQTLSSLRGVRGTLEIYAAQTRDEQTRSAYKEALQTVSGIIHDVENRLKAIEFEEPQYKGF
ncbi:MAG: DUF1657 domain-containing protein [Bacillota bacterium]